MTPTPSSSARPDTTVRCPVWSRTRWTTSRTSARTRASTSTTLRGAASAVPTDGRRRSARSASCAASVHALRAWPTPLGVAINSADEIWDGAGELVDVGGAEPTRHARHPGADLRPRRLGNGVSEVRRKTFWSTAWSTGYLEAGHGDPVVLLHGGEFGVSAELGWERNIAALAAHHRVLALDMLGFGQSAKVIDFNDGRGMRIRHIARFCDAARGRVRALRRQLDGCDQPVRRRHIGDPRCCRRAAW